MDISPQPMLATSIKETNVAQKNETSSCLHTTVYLEIQCKSSLMKNSSCVHRDLPPGGFARGAVSWAEYSEQWVKHNTQPSILSRSSTILSLNTWYSTGQVKSSSWLLLANHPVCRTQPGYMPRPRIISLHRQHTTAIPWRHIIVLHHRCLIALHRRCRVIWVS